MSLVTLARPAFARNIWPNGAQAAVSLTYDDGCDSQLENAIPLLDSMAVKATFFLTVENMDARLAEWVAVAKRGHEIGDHTMTHPCKLTQYSTAQFARKQIEPAENYFNTNFGGPMLRSFAYPCGLEKLGRGSDAVRMQRYRQVVQSSSFAARTVGGPPNDPHETISQRYLLRGIAPTYDHDEPNAALAYVEQAFKNGDWAILIFHEVLPARRGAGDTSEAVHKAIVEYVVQRPIWCAPMRDIFRHVAQASSVDL